MMSFTELLLPWLLIEDWDLDAGLDSTVRSGVNCCR